VKSKTSILLRAALIAAMMALAANGEEEILVGRNAINQLVVQVGFVEPMALPLSVFPGISGYATGELGLHSNILNDTNNDFFPPSTAADFRFILVAKDPGMEVWNDTGSGYMAVGEMYYVGQPPFDTHPVWNLVAGTSGNTYSLTLKMRDLNGIYPDSAPFTLSFTAVPYEITILQGDPAHVSLLWATNVHDWNLETASAPDATNWLVITNTPAIVGSNYSLSMATADSQQFFRLHQ
jgi:hypothetical protein